MADYSCGFVAGSSPQSVVLTLSLHLANAGQVTSIDIQFHFAFVFGHVTIFSDAAATSVVADLTQSSGYNFESAEDWELAHSSWFDPISVPRFVKNRPSGCVGFCC